MNQFVNLLLCAILLMTLAVGLGLIALGWLLVNGTLENRHARAGRRSTSRCNPIYTSVKTILITAGLLAAFGYSRQPGAVTPVAPQLTTTCRFVSYEPSGTIQGSSSGTRRDSYLATYDAGSLLTGSVFDPRSTTNYQYDDMACLNC